METIMVYLDNMFAGLPRSPEVERMKQELLSGMEDKYMELKQEGRSENEAVGIVISEFGNIEELMEELGIQTEDVAETYPMLTEEEVHAYLAAKRSAGFWTGLGVWLSSAGIAFLILMDTLFESMGTSSDQGTVSIGSVLGMSGMFVLVALAVGMFIYSGMKLGRFEYMEKGFRLPRALLMTLQRSKTSFALTYRVALITGVCLCILSPVFIFAGAYVNDTYAAYGVSALLATAGIGVFLFVYYGNIQGSYTTLLEDQHLNAAKREEARAVRAVEAVVWPLATAFFLFTGFVYQRWDINWAIFPIVGILSGSFSNVYHIMKNKKPS
ncbi:permease prefix domain 1-containing protein [Paenibacillus sp. RRE4]|uniref:permease prefix domain 1-containing protein n=1 Tax=Paenibacillus sp. RRE4 TaxID=2962587 RepID=UPI002882AD7D|nr:permease prefix domain 1-containing protein [Paenibacillus sp. RRE4]MDT0124702.1 permease prefix domain 1-containing protein [Paenibacillus sp. RRE4]